MEFNDLLFLLFFTIYVTLAIIMALIIAVLPRIWHIKIRQHKLEIVAWPMYSSWGIGWVITGLWYIYQWPIEQYLIIFFAFHVCFPVIVAGAQFNYWFAKKKIILPYLLFNKKG